MTHSKIADAIERLSYCSGSFYTFAPSEHVRREGETPVWHWEDRDPRGYDQINYGSLDSDGSRHLSYVKESPESLAELISDKKLWPVLTLLWVGDHFQSSDYGGDLCYLSNLQVLTEEHKESPAIKELYGSYGGTGLALDIRFCTDEILEAIESLENYPLLDEEHLSELEMEKEGEAWESWACSDFQRAIESRLSDLLEDEEKAEEKAESLSEDQLFELLREGMEAGNLYWETEILTRWLDVEAVASALSDERLLSL